MKIDVLPYLLKLHSSMNNKEKMISKQLIEPSKKLRKTLDGKEVTLEELESLCGTFDRRPRGCNSKKTEVAAPGEGGDSFSSIGDNDDVLF